MAPPKGSLPYQGEKPILFRRLAITSLMKTENTLMSHYKGTGILAIAKVFKSKNIDSGTFLAQLTTEELKAYKACLPITWMPLEMAEAISIKAAQVLYPGDSQALIKLGHDRAIVQINGIYKLFFRIITMNSVLENAAKLWPTQHDQGKAWIGENSGKNRASFCVSGHAALTPAFRKLIQGYVLGILETAGVKNVQTSIDEKDPNLWKWNATWTA
jgi:hypothetical protein